MKKAIFAGAALLITATAAHADMLGVKAGYNYWNTTNHEEVQSVYGSFEHFIPLVPNVAFRAEKMDSDKLSFTSYETSAYYEFLDNGNIDFDLGLGLRRIASGESNGFDFSETFPVASAEATLFEDSDLSFFGRVDLGKNGDSEFKDAQAGVRLGLFAGFSLQAGYRQYEMDLNIGRANDTETMRGFNAGIHWAF
ncbi:hypothetical protein [Endozoicomonas sp. OPT23]|uniref:hypothetical protein n=1 Tax=Endozoicomonas sp. OPT23 TaxID=2072845 RepID=UPI00129B78D9|nr:hypothetical protein [Endozoicomonas sp. OPT23]